MVPVIVKIGGAVASDRSATAELLREVAGVAGAVLVHGGGATVTEWSRRLGIEARFVDGIRVTSPAEMELADMVLAGLVNTDIVRLARSVGVRAAGLTCADDGLITGRLVGDGVVNRTAVPDGSSPGLLAILADAGILPVVASVASDQANGAVNINADDAARALAEATGAAVLCYLSDTPGVLDGMGRRIATIPVGEVEQLIGDGTVRGGMAAKIRSAADAVAAGVGRIVIGQWTGPGDLAALLGGTNGTSIAAT